MVQSKWAILEVVIHIGVYCISSLLCTDKHLVSQLML